DDEQPHQHACERAAKMKTAVKENHRQRQEAEPQMPAHPGLRAAQAPTGHALSCTEQRSKNREAEADDAKEKTNCAAAARTLRRIERVDDVQDRRGCKNRKRSDGPGAMRAVDPHFAPP